MRDSRARSTPKRARACTASQTGSGSSLPFASTALVLAVLDRVARVARYVVSPTRIPFTGAADCNRAAVLTTSPAAMPSPASGRASRLTSASPVFTAIRTCSSPSSRDPVADRERSPHRALGIVLVRDRRAEERHHRVADELLHRAAAALELVTQPLVVRRQHRLHVLGIEPLGARREAHEIGEQDRDNFPLRAGRARRLRERRAALGAELRRRLVLVAAVRADAHRAKRTLLSFELLACRLAARSPGTGGQREGRVGQSPPGGLADLSLLRVVE